MHACPHMDTRIQDNFYLQKHRATACSPIHWAVSWVGVGEGEGNRMRWLDGVIDSMDMSLSRV